MSKPVKVLTIASWALLVVVMLALVGSGMLGRAELSKPVIGKVPAFSLVDQDGKPFTAGGLKGQVWAADFIFTRCQGPCPMMTSKMSQVQKVLADTPVRLASFTVDPEYDTAEILSAYAARTGAQTGHWSFVRGEYKAIQALARGMFIGVQPATADQPIMHATYFLLVDGEGNLYGPYNGEDDLGWRELSADARKLTGKR
jgi:protein SCO1/2